MQINWDGKDENTPVQPENQNPTPFGFEFSNSSSMVDCNQGKLLCTISVVLAPLANNHPLANMTHLERCFQGMKNSQLAPPPA